MALWTCTACTTAYAVGAPRCPHCRSEEHVEEGIEMPKITRYGGATNAAAGPLVVGATWSEETEAPDTWPAAAGTAWHGEHGPALVDLPPRATVPPAEGSEQTSPGTSSKTSLPTPSAEPEPSRTPRRSRARMTANPSLSDPTDSSTAPGTAGGPTGPTSAPDA